MTVQFVLHRKRNVLSLETQFGEYMRGKKKLVRSVSVLTLVRKFLHAAYPLSPKSREVDLNTQRRLRL